MTVSLSPRAFWLVGALVLVLATPLAAQDTRGNLMPDARITLADGTSLEVQDLKVGARVWIWSSQGKAGSAKVTGVRRQHADSFIVLKADDREVRASGSHRIALASGALVRLDSVKVGDKVLIAGASGPTPAVVASLRLYPVTMVAYDLTVEGHLPFFVDGVLLGD